MANYVVIAALAMSIASFLVYVAIGYVSTRAKLKAHDEVLKAHAEALKAEADAPKMDATAISNIPDIIDALTKFVVSLSKAGPALTSITASILFLLIAAVASGAIGAGNAQGSAAAHAPRPHDTSTPAQ